MGGSEGILACWTHPSIRGSFPLLKQGENGNDEQNANGDCALGAESGCGCDGADPVRRLRRHRSRGPVAANRGPADGRCPTPRIDPSPAPESKSSTGHRRGWQRPPTTRVISCWPTPGSNYGRPGGQAVTSPGLHAGMTSRSMALTLYADTLTPSQSALAMHLLLPRPNGAHADSYEATTALASYPGLTASSHFDVTLSGAGIPSIATTVSSLASPATTSEDMSATPLVAPRRGTTGLAVCGGTRRPEYLPGVFRVRRGVHRDTRRPGSPVLSTAGLPTANAHRPWVRGYSSDPDGANAYASAGRRRIN